MAHERIPDIGSGDHWSSKGHDREYRCVWIFFSFHFKRRFDQMHCSCLSGSPSSSHSPGRLKQNTLCIRCCADHSPSLRRAGNYYQYCFTCIKVSFMIDHWQIPLLYDREYTIQTSKIYLEPYLIQQFDLVTPLHGFLVKAKLVK